MSALRQTPALPEMVTRYNLKTFVETGCDEGDGLRYAQSLGLSPRYSCDLNPVNAAICQQWGIVATCSSVDFLRHLRKFVRNRPSLFWLDAHFPFTWGMFVGEEFRFPVLEELKILATYEGIEKSVIVCDDICNIQSDDNPTRMVGSPSCAVQGLTIAELVAPMLPTHIASLHQVDTGILVLEPRP